MSLKDLGEGMQLSLELFGSSENLSSSKEELKSIQTEQVPEQEKKVAKVILFDSRSRIYEKIRNRKPC